MLTPDAKFAPFAKTSGGRQEVTPQNLWRVVGRELGALMLHSFLTHLYESCVFRRIQGVCNFLTFRWSEILILQHNLANDKVSFHSLELLFSYCLLTFRLLLFEFNK